VYVWVWVRIAQTWIRHTHKNTRVWRVRMRYGAYRTNMDTSYAQEHRRAHTCFMQTHAHTHAHARTRKHTHTLTHTHTHTHTHTAATRMSMCDNCSTAAFIWVCCCSMLLQHVAVCSVCRWQHLSHDSLICVTRLCDMIVILCHMTHDCQICVTRLCDTIVILCDMTHDPWLMPHDSLICVIRLCDMICDGYD